MSNDPGNGANENRWKKNQRGKSKHKSVSKNRARFAFKTESSPP